MTTPDIDLVLTKVQWFHAATHQPATYHGIVTHDGALLDSTFNEIARTIPGCPANVERFTLTWTGWMALIHDANTNRVLGSLTVVTGAGA
jgi:hypothetical protein